MGIFILIWGIINIFFLVAKKFNPYSFVVLNVILSFFMFIFCSLIIFNQNKMKKLDEKKSENDYKVNLKNEIIIEDLHYLTCWTNDMKTIELFNSCCNYVLSNKNLEIILN